VEFLCSPKGGWINAQLLMSNGGFRITLRNHFQRRAAKIGALPGVMR
jgi:hypothetical protein